MALDYCRFRKVQGPNPHLRVFTCTPEEQVEIYKILVEKGLTEEINRLILNEFDDRPVELYCREGVDGDRTKHCIRFVRGCKRFKGVVYTEWEWNEAWSRFIREKKQVRMPLWQVHEYPRKDGRDVRRPWIYAGEQKYMTLVATCGKKIRAAWIQRELVDWYYQGKAEWR